MKSLRISTLGLVLALLAGSPEASGQAPELPMGKWWKRPGVVNQLKLTGDQQERLETIFSKNRRTFIDLKAELEKRQVDLEELMVARSADPKKIVAASDALEAARAKLARTRTLMFLDMRAVLTPEQWDAILARRDEWRQERDGLRDRMPREGPRGGPPRAQPPEDPRPPQGDD